MKTLYISGGASDSPMTLENGDKLDTTWTLKDESGNILFFSKHCNRIPSKMLFGKNQIALHGILTPGNYCGVYQENIKGIGDGVVLFLEKYRDEVKKRDDLTDEMIVFPSLKKNPSMGNRMLVSAVICHSTNGDQGNGSEGCQTCYYRAFHTAYAGAKSFESQFKPDDIIDIVIMDTPEFTQQLETLIKSVG